MPIVSQSASTMYVPMGNSNDLVIIDLETDKVIGRIGELENAHGLATSSNSNYLVAGSMKPVGDKSVAAKPAMVGEDDHAAHHAGDTDNAARSKMAQSYVSIVDIAQKRVIRRIAVRGLTHHTAVSPDGKTAIAVHSGAGGISVIDLDKMVVVKTLQTGAQPNYAVFDRVGKRLYVSNSGAGTISAIDTATWSVISETGVGKGPEHMVRGVRVNRLYVVNTGDGVVTATNMSDGRVIKSFPVGPEPHGVDISADGRWMFAASKGGDTLTRVDIGSGKSTSIELGPAPYHVAFIRDKKKLYVSSRKEPKIWVINPVTLKITGEIDLITGVAHQMVIRND